MSGRHFAIALLYAAGTFGLTMAIGLPKTLNAVSEADIKPMSVMINSPKLTISGIDFHVEVSQPTTQPSAQPEDSANIVAGSPLTLQVKATSGLYGATADFTVRLTSWTGGGGMGRTLPIPKDIWHENAVITLGPGQAKTLSFKTIPLPANSMINVLIGAGKENQIAAMTLAPKTDQPKTDQNVLFPNVAVASRLVAVKQIAPADAITFNAAATQPSAPAQ